jgi:hypothetical protein
LQLYGRDGQELRDSMDVSEMKFFLVSLGFLLFLLVCCCLSWFVVVCSYYGGHMYSKDANVTINWGVTTWSRKAIFGINVKRVTCIQST